MNAPSTRENGYSLRSTDTLPHLVVRFEKLDDRWVHHVEVVGLPLASQQSVRLLSSSEGSGEQPWPPSPPVQACQSELDRYILGTGMAGKSHWSIALCSEDNALIWDVACRFKRPPESLGSAYQLVEPAEEVTGGFQWKLDEQFSCKLSASLEPATAARVLRGEADLCIRPADVEAPPATSRWLYRLQLEEHV